MKNRKLFGNFVETEAAEFPGNFVETFGNHIGLNMPNQLQYPPKHDGNFLSIPQ